MPHYLSLFDVEILVRGNWLPIPNSLLVHNNTLSIEGVGVPVAKGLGGGFPDDT